MNPLMNNANNSGIMGLVKMLKGGNSDYMVQILCQRNPQLARFLRENQGKDPKSVAEQYGLDWMEILNLLHM